MPEDITLDNANAVELVDLKIRLEAIEDKIIVMMDKYKSGYECTACGGTGKVRANQFELIPSQTCEVCRGRGGILVIPEVSKSLPTSGIVVSLGEKTRTRQGDETALIKLGTRVIFSPHVGTLIPFKGNVRLKIMREHEPLAIMYGADAAARDFMDYDQPF